MADIMALLGDTQSASFFSFLNAKRFRSEPGSPAKHFVGQITWHNGDIRQLQLDKDPNPQAVQRIKYIPQKYFEELCNDHVTNKSDRFEQELRHVIFSHIDPADRLGKTSFDALLVLKEKELVESQRGIRIELSKTNERLEVVEGRMYPSVREGIQARLTQKQSELTEYEKLKPDEVPSPPVAPSEEQQSSFTKLAEVENRISLLQSQLTDAANGRRSQSARIAAIARIRERLSQIKRYIDTSAEELSEELGLVGLQFNQVLKFEYSAALLDQAESDAVLARQKDDDALDPGKLDSVAHELSKAKSHQAQLQAALDAPQKNYQAYRLALKAWEDHRLVLIGDDKTPETINALTSELNELNGLPTSREELNERRKILSKELFALLLKQRLLREELFKPVQTLIEANPLILEKYKLHFQSFLGVRNFDARFFEIVRQNSGSFRGDDEGREFLKTILQAYDLATEEGLFAFLEHVMTALETDLRTEGTPPSDLGKLIRTGKSRKDLYNFLFGLEYLEPRYSLLFQETSIERLSPGQRGALLLIFYLLVDRDGHPIVLDQPEENLDNETVVSLLVPVVKEAKKTRQIIMVTHNPNLAVVCDAEQIIHAHFSRTEDHKVTYTAGAIEDPKINRLVVDVLEGTKPAFDNRGGKYHEEI